MNRDELSVGPDMPSAKMDASSSDREVRMVHRPSSYSEGRARRPQGGRDLRLG